MESVPKFKLQGLFEILKAEIGIDLESDCIPLPSLEDYIMKSDEQKV